MPTVLITPFQFRDPQAEFFAPLHEAGFELVFPTDQSFTHDPQALLKLLSDVDCVMASTEPYGAEILEKAGVRAIARTGVGFDSIDIAAATRCNVVVTITPGALEQSVAEHTLALIFAVYRNVVGRDREVRSGQWSRASLPRLAGKTLGLVGLGRIGRSVAQLGQSVGLKIIAHDPFPNEAFARGHGIGICSLDEVLSQADIVSLHLPSTAATANLINSNTLKQMKRDAVLVNTGRGPLVDEDALCDAIRGGHLLGAALDVFKTEPLPTDSPLLSLPRVILTTHTAGLDDQSQLDMPRIAADCLVKLHAGLWPEDCVVNPQLRDNWTW